MENAEFRNWNVASDLQKINKFTVNYSRGFLLADIGKHFTGIEKYWNSFFQLISQTVENVSVEQSIGFQPEFFWQSLIEIEGEKASLGLDKQSFATLSESVVDAEEFSMSGADVAVEYLVRRFLSTLEKISQEVTDTPFVFLSERPSFEDTFLSSVVLSFSLSGKPIKISFSLGPLATDSLDRFFRNRFAKESILSTIPGDVVSLSVELVENTVEPAKLIDYMRADALVDLESQISSKVKIRVENEFWANGNLLLCDDTIVVSIDNFKEDSSVVAEGGTRMRVELSRIEISAKEFAQYQKIGSKMFTTALVGDPVTILISGEQVASATLGCLGDNFALKVLPK